MGGFTDRKLEKMPPDLETDFALSSLPAGVMEKARMNKENALLIKRLIAYKSYFDPGPGEMHH